MKVGKKAIVQYFLLYLLLIMHGAVVWVLKYSLSYAVLGILCVLSLFFIYNYNRIEMEKQPQLINGTFAKKIVMI